MSDEILKEEMNDLTPEEETAVNEDIPQEENNEVLEETVQEEDLSSEQEETPVEEGPQEELAQEEQVEEPTEEIVKDEVPAEEVALEEQPEEVVTESEVSNEEEAPVQEEQVEEPIQQETPEEEKQEEPSKKKKEKPVKEKKQKPDKKQASEAPKANEEEKNLDKKEDNKDSKKKSNSRISKTAKRRRFLIFIVTLYFDLVILAIFFLKGYFTEFVNGILNGAYLSLQNHFAFVASVLMIVVFLVINIISLSLRKDAKKIKGDQNANLLNILNDTDDIDGRNVVEEEFAVDEAGKVVYRTSRTVESIDMNRVYNDFIKYALSQGIAVDKITAREIFASLAACRLVFIKNTVDKGLRDKFLKVITDFFGVDFYKSSVSPNTSSFDSLVWNRAGAVSVATDFSKGLLAARQLPDKINIAFLDGVEPASMHKYFKELFEYCKNPEVPCFVKIGAKNVDGGLRDLPKNLWFILCLENDDLIPSEVAKYSITLTLNIKESTEEVGEVKYKQISYPQFVDAINEGYEDHFISEDMWKKLDEFEAYLAKRGEYFIDNRIVREMERFAAIFLLCDGEQTDLIDTLLSKKLLLIALPNTYTYLENDEETIMGMAEKIIGADYIANSQSILKQIKAN